MGVCLLLMLSGRGIAADTGDPLASVNRATQRFNTVVDSHVVRPLARAYGTLVPTSARQGVQNVFGNLQDVGIAVNNLLQGKFRAAGSDLGRVAVNSTLGVGGLWNVAGPWFGLEKHSEDFGQTLAQWGIGSGPYVVLPFLGPSTVRDAIGLVPDRLLNPVAHLDDPAARNALTALPIIDLRQRLLPLDDLRFGDEYLYFRDAYLQRRADQISDGATALVFEPF